MDTLSNASDTNYELPLSEADQAALRPALLHDLGALPFKPGALISRSLWVIFIGKWGIWTLLALQWWHKIQKDSGLLTEVCGDNSHIHVVCK